MDAESSPALPVPASDPDEPARSPCLAGDPCLPPGSAPLHPLCRQVPRRRALHPRRSPCFLCFVQDDEQKRLARSSVGRGLPRSFASGATSNPPCSLTSGRAGTNRKRREGRPCSLSSVLPSLAMAAGLVVS